MGKSNYVCSCGSSNVIDHNGAIECLDCGKTDFDY
jgi:hypothetical protein